MASQVSSFNLNEYIGGITKTAEEAIASKSIPAAQELEVYINGFEESLIETQRLRASVQERIQQLQSSLYQEEGGLARDAVRLLTAFEREFGAFEGLEKRFDAVGSAAIRAGQQVERLRAERLRALEAQELVKLFVELCANPEAMGMRLSDAVLSGPTLEHCREAVIRLRRMLSLSKALHDRVTPQCTAAISEAAQRVENGLLERFHAAFDADDRVAMRAPAALLISFSGGASVIGSFVSKHAFFLDPVMVEQVRSRYCDRTLMLDMTKDEPVDPVIEGLFKALIDTIEEDWRFIVDVFDSPSLVMEALLTRIIQEPVQVTVEAVLSQAAAHSPFAFLRALACTRAAARRLASDLCKSLQDRQSIQPASIEVLLEGLFSPYLPRLVEKELEASSLLLETSFQPLAASLKAKRSAARLPSFLRSSSKADKDQAPPSMNVALLSFANGTLLQDVRIEEGAPPLPAIKRSLSWVGEALTRLYALLPEDQRGPALERLYTAVYEKVAEMLIIALDTCMELAEGADTAHLHVAAASTGALSSLQKAHQNIAAPLLVTAAPPSFRAAVLLKDRLFTAVAGKIDALLRAEVTAWMEYIKDNLLAKQRSSDFKPRDDEITMGTTQTCAGVCKFLKQITGATLNILDAENARLVLTELGRSLNQALLLHIKNHSISDTGALALRNDLRAYSEAVDAMGPASVVLRPAFALLCDLATVFLMRPENLRAHIQETSSLAQLDSRSLMEFIRLRADWRSAKLEKIFPEASTGSAGISSFFELTAHDL